MKKYIKVIALIIALTCILSCFMISSFATPVGNEYNLDTYTVNGSRGYFQSNFAYNRNTNCIMRGETKVVPSTNKGRQVMILQGASGIFDQDDLNTDSVGSSTIVNTITYSNVGYLASGVSGNIRHLVTDSSGTLVAECKYIGTWASPTEGWDYTVLVTNYNLD